jgi:hypothetical protein
MQSQPVLWNNRIIGQLAAKSHKGNIKRLHLMGGVWWKAQHVNVTFTCEFQSAPGFLCDFRAHPEKQISFLLETKILQNGVTA